MHPRVFVHELQVLEKSQLMKQDDPFPPQIPQRSFLRPNGIPSHPKQVVPFPLQIPQTSTFGCFPGV